MFGGCLPVDDRTTDSPSLNRKGNLTDKGNGNAEKKENRKRRAANKRSAFACLLYRRNIVCAELLVILDTKMQKKSC